jgi:hypothetical protein
MTKKHMTDARIPMPIVPGSGELYGSTCGCPEKCTTVELKPDAAIYSCLEMNPNGVAEKVALALFTTPAPKAMYLCVDMDLDGVVR